MKAVRILAVAAVAGLLGLAATAVAAGKAGASPAVRPAPAAAAKSVLPARIDRTAGTEWWGIYFQKQKVGWGNQEISGAPGGEGYLSRSESWFRLKLLDVTREVRMTEESRLNRDWSLASMRFAMKATDVDLSLDAKVEPACIAVTIRSGGLEQTVEVPRPAGDGPVYSSSALSPYLSYAGLLTGKSYSLNVFDPTTQTRQILTADVLGEEKIEGSPAFHVRTNMLGIQSENWITREGESLREETQDGFVVVREPEAVAKAGVSTSPSDMAEDMAVSIGKPVRQQARLGKLVLKLTGVDTAGFDLDGDGQRFQDGILTVTKEPLPASAGYELPFKGDEKIAAYVKPEPMIASDHPKMIAKAREIIGTTKDPLAASMKLMEWVYRNVDKQPVFSLPNALDVLERLKGDCNEHTALLTALGRAAGIPTKQEAGLVHLEGTGRFYYHAWVSFYLGGRWVGADAAFGQFPVDVTHLRFMDGGADRQTQISRLIGRLRLELVEAV